MLKKLSIILLICVLLTVIVLSSGCTDSGEESEVEEDAGSAAVSAEAAAEETEDVDDSLFTNSIGMEFVRIPVGEFAMGSLTGRSIVTVMRGRNIRFPSQMSFTWVFMR